MTYHVQMIGPFNNIITSHFYTKDEFDDISIPKGGTVFMLFNAKNSVDLQIKISFFILKNKWLAFVNHLLGITYPEIHDGRFEKL